MAEHIHSLDPQYRARGIGGSEAGAILGLDPWKTPVEVWHSKVHPPEAPEPDSEAAAWGRKLEGVLAEEYAHRANRTVVVDPRDYVSKSHPWMFAHIDRRIVREPAFLEIKTTGFWGRDAWGPTGSDEFPDRVKAQCEHYLHVTELKRADICVLIGGQDFRMYSYRSDPQFKRILLERLSDFWHQHVLREVPPPVTTGKDAELLFAEDDGSTFQADTDLARMVYDARKLKDEIKALGTKREALEAQIKAAIGPSQVATAPDGSKLVSWKAQTSNRIDAKRLRAEAPAVADAYTTQSTARVLRY